MNKRVPWANSCYDNYCLTLLACDVRVNLHRQIISRFENGNEICELTSSISKIR